MENKNPVWKYAMNYGAIIGIALVVYQLILYVFDIFKTGFWVGVLISLASMLILILGIIFSTKHYRNNTLGGIISYKQALVFGTLICLFSSVITGFFNYLLNAVIDPGYQERMMQAMQESVVGYMSNMGVSESEIENTVERMNGPLPSPFKTAITSVLWGTAVGFILSLITSAFLKKEGNPFDAAMNNNTDQPPLT